MDEPKRQAEREGDGDAERSGDGRRASIRRRREHPEVERAVDQCGDETADLLAVLGDAKSRCGHLGRDVVGAAADALAIPDARVQGVATFYSLLSTALQPARVVRLCDGPSCMLAGAAEVAVEVKQELAGDDGWSCERTSCLGLCDRAPAALRDRQPLGPLDRRHLSDIRGKAQTEVAQLTATPADPVADYAEPLAGETRVALARLGRVDPDSLPSALDAGSYQTWSAALARPPRELLDVVEASGLQGRGGAGFPAGRKWRMVAEASDPRKVIVCNADESEPGAFKDRVLLEGDPHLLLEGIALAAYAIGAGEGFLYVRGEYETAARRLERAIAAATEAGYLGSNIRGSGYALRLHVHRGAGAYICGEETALLESLEGRRGEPRVRPPYPTTSGYLGHPTAVNNVETLCLVPEIVARGADAFRRLGTAGSPGTKLFTISGHVRRPGVVEVPLGVTLRQLIDDFAGGLPDGRHFKIALSGGAAGTLVPKSLLDLPLDFTSHARGVSLGSGAVVVADDTVSAATFTLWLLHFFETESCGKCTPCRLGTREARRILERIAAGRGRPGDTDRLAALAHTLETTSLCGLGTSVAWPLQSALEHFPEDFAIAT